MFHRLSVDGDLELIGGQSLAGWLFQMGFLCEVYAEEVAMCLFGQV